MNTQKVTMMSKDEFETTDIVLAAYLKTKNFRLVEIVKNGNKGTFVFAGVDQTFIDEYDLGEASVEPKSLNHEIKALTTAARR
jgi:hypothetical protein